MTDFFDSSQVPATGGDVTSAVVRAEFDAVEAGISDKLAPVTGNGDKVIVVNSAGTAYTVATSLTVAQGGSNRATGGTAYGLIAAGTTATGTQQTVPPGATTDILVGGGASALPVWTAATGSGAPVRATSPALVTPDIGTPSAGVLTNCTGLPVTGGGLGLSSGTSGGIPAFTGTTTIASSGLLTQHGILLGGGAGAAPSAAAAMTNGQLLIGSTGVAPVVGSLTAGANITITPGAGSISIAATSSALTPQSETTTTTLTSTPTLLTITPASYGVRVHLPDATSMSEGYAVHVVVNNGAYPVLVDNDSGTLLGFVPAGVVGNIALSDNSSAAGVWAIENGEKTGVSAFLKTSDIASAENVIALDADRDFILGAGTGYYSVGLIYNHTTNTWGDVTTIRATDVRGNHRAIKTATDQILVVSCTKATTAFEAVVLTCSGTGFTPGTAATATLSGNIDTGSYFAENGLKACGAGWVISYKVDTPARQLRAITISGTTPTIGDAVALPGTGSIGNFGSPIYVSGSVVIAASTATSHLYVTPYSLSGVTLSIGTGTDTDSGTMTLLKFADMGSGRWLVIYHNATNTYGGIVTLTATTTTISAAQAFATTGFTDAYIASTSKVCMLSTDATSNVNVLTDSAGTASAGTAITASAQTTRQCLYASGTTVVIKEGTTTANVRAIDCSGASPVAGDYLGVPGFSTDYAASFTVSNTNLVRYPNAVFGATYAKTLNSTAGFATEISGTGSARLVPMHPENSLFNGASVSPYNGSSANTAWLSTNGIVANAYFLAKVECVN